MTQVFLSIGSNLGNRHHNIERAIQYIEQVVGSINQRSSIYETPPWGYHSKNDYLNCCIELETDIVPSELLVYLKDIEYAMGRVQSEHYTDRMIDIDILFYGDQQINAEHLTIPHPKIAERLFVLIPLHEICPNWQHPTLFLTISQLLSLHDSKKKDFFIPLRAK